MKILSKVLLIILMVFSNSVLAWQTNKVKEPSDIRGHCGIGNAKHYSDITIDICIARIIEIWGGSRYDFTGEPYNPGGNSWTVQFYYYSGIAGNESLYTWGDFDYHSLTEYTAEQLLGELPDNAKELGMPCDQNKTFGNPCNSSTGNKFQQEVDIHTDLPSASFIRRYNSQRAYIDVGLGFGWTANQFPFLEKVNNKIASHRTDGQLLVFAKVNNLWQGDADSHLTLTQDTTGYTLTNDDSNIERYNLDGSPQSITNRIGQQTTYAYTTEGLLQTITGPFGHQLTFVYNADNRIQSVTDPDTQVYQYQYDNVGNLIKVIYPDTTFKQYHYENTAFPHALTGITDENGDRFATFTYAADGKAIATEHAITTNTTAQEHFNLSYDSATQTTVTDPVGTIEVLTFENKLGVKNLISRINQSDNKGMVRSYDTNNNLISSTDAENSTTTYVYNASHQRITITEAAGTPEQLITQMTYLSPGLDLPTLITKPSVVAGQAFTTAIQYNTDHTVQSIKLDGYHPDGTTINHNTVFQYNTAGQVTQIDGPLTAIDDVIILTYYECTTGKQCGQLASITNALGHTTTFDSYDNHGRIKQSTSPLGLISSHSYDLRGRLITLTQIPPQAQGNSRTTTFIYDSAGQLISVTTPTGATLTYTYDAAHDLRSISDSLGNRIEYKYDLKGNRTDEIIKDSEGNLVKNVQTQYDLRNQIKTINKAGSISQLIHDAVGNLISETNPKQNPATTHSYDTLSRLQQTIDALGNGTNYQYNVNDQLIQVNAPNGAITQYEYDDFGNLLKEVSADRGVSQYQYDKTGNRTSQTDAKGITVNYTYDALNRLTSILYPDSSLDIHYSYDGNNTGQNGIGRLTTLTDASGTTIYGYDKGGNLTAVTVIRDSITFNTKYAYNGADQLAQITYPSGRMVDYGYDSAGRINSVSTTDSQGSTQNLLTDVEYEPFGPINAMIYGNGLPSQSSFDLDYRPTDLNTSPALDRSYVYDKADNITGIINNLMIDQDQSYAYDGLNRLIDAQSFNDTRLYQYDSNGNRTQLTDNGTTDNYQYLLESNHLQNINSTQLYSYDANGNTTHLPNMAIFTELVYGDHNRLSEVNGVKYIYNGNGQRVTKDNGTQTHYHYGLGGQLIAETDGQGNTQKEYVYLEDLLIGLVEKSTGNSGNTEIVLDNPDASFSDNWTYSTGVNGYQGSNYQFHAGSSTVGPGVVGDPIDNHFASFTGTWPKSTSVNTYYGKNYQFHAGSTAGLGVLGNPVDNQQASFTGTWPNSTSVKQFYAGNYQYHAAGTGANTATWSAGVSSTGSYDVYINWTAHANRASNAKFTIHHANGSDTVTVNQKLNGGQWNLLGTYPLDNNSTISLSDDANGYVIADAISILPAGSPPAVTQQDETANWALNITTPGRYDVYTNWASHANRATDAKYTIYHGNGSHTITVNQRQNGGQWNLLGTFDLDANSSVELSSVANGYVIADAVSILPEGTSPETTTQGETATWTPNQTGEFEIYANWTAHANRATDAKYTIAHVSGSDTINVNQQQNGGQWQLLGAFTLNTSSTISLSSAANGYVIADGIRLVEIAPTTTSGIYFVHPDHLGTPQVITDENQGIVWQANYDPFGKASIITENITNNIRFPGQYYDQETGLHYNHYRYYNPQTGRYITSDPIGLSGGLNTYAYVGGNPLTRIDPSGLEFVLPFPGAAGAGGAGAAGASATATAGAAVVGAGLAGYGLGSLIYPHIAEPLGNLIDKVCSSENKDDKKKCKLYTQNKIDLPPGKIRCTYLCPLDSGGRGFVTRILDGNSCPAEFDANSVSGDQGF